jgi:hypothetical protein
MDNSNQSNGQRAEGSHFPENSEAGHWRGFGAPANSRFDGMPGSCTHRRSLILLYRSRFGTDYSKRNHPTLDDGPSHTD